MTNKIPEEKEFKPLPESIGFCELLALEAREAIPHEVEGKVVGYRLPNSDEKYQGQSD